MIEYNLLPCPFCGGKPKLEEKYRSFIAGKSERVAVVICQDCGARASRIRISDYGKSSHSVEATERAVQIWNTRAFNFKLIERSTEHDT